MSEDGNPKIYLLPNLATALNLCFGFAAILKILEGALQQTTSTEPDAGLHNFHAAIICILIACFWDLLDGRLARLGGHESDFGREFDSIADIVSFGVAPALMVYRIVLHEFPRAGWIVASIYLVCGALRLARFNCLAAADSASANKEFKGFPIPAAAGMIASLTMFILWWQGGHVLGLGNWKWVLPPLMIFLSFMMFSGFKYPSFKSINWRTRRSIPQFIVIILVLGATFVFYEWLPAIVFIAYLIYGFVRPFISRQWRREIEEDEDDEERDEQTPPQHESGSPQ
ncbi:MAG TPA: CDP-diacylglycerol--serine O-phosphatidyltransferase [Chthoniobacteraceae bacterium]|nr:CDP-diacylglycerol--serine O-phosphatidyltransferase [Chthoniobacteraceae bacterium]